MSRSIQDIQKDIEKTKRWMASYAEHGASSTYQGLKARLARFKRELEQAK